jgi:hypothetical protein
MEGLDILMLVLSLGIGGIAGALAAVSVTGAAAQAAFEFYRDSFQSYMQGRTDPQSRALQADFDDFSETMRASGGALERLRRALRRR